MKELIKWANILAKEYPKYKEEIFYYVKLCQKAIKDGGIIEHEIELCKESIMDQIEE